MDRSSRFQSLGLVSIFYLFLFPAAIGRSAPHQHQQEDEKQQYHPMGPSYCSDMEVWDVDFAMCMPLAMKGMPMQMFMLHGNGFGVYSTSSGPRGRSGFSSPNMVMADLGSSLGDNHYLDLNVMLTAEKWTFPERGYAELLQIGEHDENGKPYLDAQHPHSSPIMGLTLSDTITLGRGKKDHLKLFFAPRGQSTDGPIAFMHRQTGMSNPDAPLGHHIGQDVGHITSTVIGASLKLGDARIQASTFNGTEPEPAHVDLPLGTPNSYAMRLVGEFSPAVMGMISGAHVKKPEADDPSIPFVNRYSASLYTQHSFSEGWKFHNTFIYGLVANYDHAGNLSSFGDEFLLHGGTPRIWGRAEVLQRTPNEFQIASPDPHAGKWVGVFTLGYTHQLASWSGIEVLSGGSVTKTFLRSEYEAAYGGNPLAGKVFLQISGNRMWEL